jgi:hypothetical protein
MNMDASDSSDDEKNSVGGKPSKLKIVDVIYLFFAKMANFFIGLFFR